MSKLEKYYELQKNSEEQYKKLLKKMSNQTTSREFFTLENGVLEPVRKQLHNNIIENYLSSYSSQTAPRIHFILGSIGSGKTSLKDTIVKNSNTSQFLYINFDDLKLKFPEYEILKKLNPKKAAHFVQSESAKLAGKLYRKAIKNKINIIYEKNLRLDKTGRLHLISEVKNTFKKGYIVRIDVVFLSSWRESWRRVKLRYEEIKRYVPKTEVYDTFNNLFPNLNKLLNENFNADYSVNLWYNGVWNAALSRAYVIGVIFFQNKRVLNTSFKEEDFAVLFESSLNDSSYSGGLLTRALFLPESAKQALSTLDCLKISLKILNGKINDLIE